MPVPFVRKYSRDSLVVVVPTLQTMENQKSVKKKGGI